MELLPQYYVISVIAILGAIIGSFLDVIVCRFHTGRSINGRSRCMSCGHTLSWWELFPLLSYIILRGKCTACGGYIPMRLLWMELFTASLFVYVYLNTSSMLELAVGLPLVSLFVVIAVYDINHMVIPNEFVLAMLGAALVVLISQTGFTFTAPILLQHVLSALLASSFYAALWFVSKGRWIGFGDVKLAIPLGLMLVPFEAFSMVVLSFWVGAGVSIVLLGLQKLLQSGKKHLRFLSIPLTMKSEVPFAPFLIAAFVLVFFQNIQVTALMSYFFQQ